MNSLPRWAALTALLLASILVPFLLWEAELAAWSERLLSVSAGRAAVATSVVALLTLDVLLPIPSSFVAAAAVSLLGYEQGGLLVWVGFTVAAWLGYGVGRLGHEAVVLRLIGRLELERARSALARRGAWVLLACRGVPVLAEASTLVAGATRYSPLRFAVVTLLGNAGLALAYSTISWFELQGTWAVLLPFTGALVVPGVTLLVARAVGLGRSS